MEITTMTDDDTSLLLHDATIRSLIETIRDTAVVMFTTNAAAAAPPSPLMKIYGNLAQTFNLVIRFIREYRRHLLSSGVFDHRRHRCQRSVARGRRVDDDNDHSTSYDHYHSDHSSSSSSEHSLMARCTVVAMEYVRDLTAQMVRSIIVHKRQRQRPSSSTSLSLPTSDDYDRRSTASFFTYAHKKIVTQAIRLIAQRTLERAAATILPPEDDEDNPTTEEKLDNNSSYASSSSSSSSSAASSLTCYVCSRTFDKTFHYLQHIRVHYRLNLYLCAHCGESFVQQNGLNYHVSHCCAAAARNRSDVALSTPHPLERRSNDGPHYELCNSCGRFFRNGQHLRNHVLTKHAVRNADLGVNRTQQEYICKILRDM